MMDKPGKGGYPMKTGIQKRSESEWQITYRVPGGGRRIETVAGTKQDAEKKLSQVLNEQKIK